MWDRQAAMQTIIAAAAVVVGSQYGTLSFASSRIFDSRELETSRTNLFSYY